MSNNQVIDAVVVVDTEGLRAKYPNGIPIHDGADPMYEYFNVLVDSEHHYEKGGITCVVGNKIDFRSIPKSNTNNNVIIAEFADKNDKLDPKYLVDYISFPAFRTSRREGYSYDNRNFPKSHIWNKWQLWFAPLKSGTKVEDSYMGVEALQSTKKLDNQCISYTLGFSVTYFDGVTLSFYFDPLINIK